MNNCQVHTSTKPLAITKEPHLHTKHYVLFVLWLVAIFRFVDLQILAVILEPIKLELDLSDTQLSLLGGFAFALFYGSLGIPVARLAERYSRRNIIAFSVGLWSLMTALCGQATGFISLFLARMGVGIGEAGAYPPTVSLLADYYPPKQRGRACAVLASAIPIGVFIGFMVSGVLAQHWGWRAAFSVVGLPGLALALIVYLSVKEAPRGVFEKATDDLALPKESFNACLKLLWAIHPYRYLVLASCCFTMGAAGSGVWIPSYFIRHHGLSNAEIGVWMASVYGGGGLLGTLLGGWLGEAFNRNKQDPALLSKVCCISLALLLPVLPLIFLSKNPYVALSLLVLMTTLMHINTGPVLAMLQFLSGYKRRATAHAISLLFTNLIALPLGPLFVGLSSDLLSPKYGSATLGFAIMVLLLISWSLAAWAFWRCAKLMGKSSGSVSN